MTCENCVVDLITNNELDFLKPLSTVRARCAPWTYKVEDATIHSFIPKIKAKEEDDRCSHGTANLPCPIRQPPIEISSSSSNQGGRRATETKDSCDFHVFVDGDLRWTERSRGSLRLCRRSPPLAEPSADCLLFQTEETVGRGTGGVSPAARSRRQHEGVGGDREGASSRPAIRPSKTKCHLTGYVG